MNAYSLTALVVVSLGLASQFHLSSSAPTGSAALRAHRLGPSGPTRADYETAYHWLSSFGYMQTLADGLENVSLDELKERVAEGLVSMKTFYHIEPVNGNLTQEVLDTMSESRCGKPDNEGTALANGDSLADAGRRKRWTQFGTQLWRPENMPLTLKFANFLPTLTRRQQKQAVKYCTDLWSEHSSLQFKLNSLAQQPNIEIMYEKIDGPWDVLGRAVSPKPQRSPPTSALRLDSEENWTASKDATRDEVSLVWVMCHEIGHTLGLGHSQDKKALMYPSLIRFARKGLGDDDIAGIAKLYPKLEE